jgi:hypothetical protein
MLALADDRHAPGVGDSDNVCRIFDLARHAGSSGTGAEREVLFLTLELLPGETLLERVRRQGALPTAEALPLVEQFGLVARRAAALARP